jgi:alpha-N-arabinofuranosidase
VKDKWEKFHANLIPDRSDDNATLTIEFRAPGTIWIDKVSLMPEGNVNGWRQDCVKAVQVLRPGVIRFGGCTVESYEWTEGVGDLDHRVPFALISWGGLEPNNVGLEEFITFCRVVDAEPLICVRYTGKTPQDAADQVEYFNGSVNTPFGRRRAANGHPKPYSVKYWQIGNEIEDPKYESDLPAFCESMKKVDPNIQLFSSFASREMIRNAGTYLGYVCPHHYGCGNLARMEAEIQRICRDLEEIVPERKIKIAVTEWNTTGGDWGVGRNSLWTLENAIACARYHNLIQRYCDIVEIAIRSNLTNSFCSGIIQTRGGNLFKTPTYYVDQLYSNHSGVWPLYVESEVSSDQLDINASLSSSGKKVHLFAINSTLDKIPIKVDFSALKEKVNQTKVWTVMDTKLKGKVVLITVMFLGRGDPLTAGFSPCG